MRRPVGLILVGVGAFLLALGPLVRFYVVDQIVRAPLNFYQSTTLEARNASYFDMAAFKVRTGATLAARNTTRGDVRAANGDDDIAVWDSSTEIYDKGLNKRIEIQGYRIAFDRRTSELVNCCGINVGGDTKVRMSGYGLLFPLADVKKQDYSFFDTTTRRPIPNRFQGVENIGGIDTYRFVQDVPNTKTVRLGAKLPGRMLGLGAKSGDRAVDRYFAARITTWVDPRTGIPVKHRQDIRSTVQTDDQKGRMTVAAADLVTTDAATKGLVDKADGYALKLRLFRTILPIGSLAGGAVLLVTGCMLGLLAGPAPRRPAPAAPSGPPPPAAESAEPAEPAEAAEPDPAPRRPDGKFGERPAAPAETGETRRPDGKFGARA